MTQKEKDLLLKDLCARLPYAPKGVYSLKCDSMHSIMFDYLTLSIIDRFMTEQSSYTNEIIDIKLYLRPMTSMTEEEKIKLYQITGFYYFSNNELLKDEWRQFSNALSENKLFLPYPIWEDDLQKTFDWLNANHFDYHGLIEKGLALEASEGMYEK